MSDNTNKVVVQFIGDATQLERTMKRVEGALTGMNESVSKSMFKAMVGFELLKHGLRMVGSAIVGGTDDAIRYEAIMDTLGQRLGKSAEQFVKWSETTGRAMGFSKLQSAEMANTLSVTLSQIATSQEDLTNKTTTLMEASAIIRSKTGRTMNDVSERIRSAMNQEADGADELGLNVRTNAITMSDAYRRMADGTPWKDLTTNQQKAILYQYILDQTAQNFGTTMADNTSLKMAQFTASLADMKLALGQAFLPIVNVALPYLNALVQWITVALSYVRVFLETLFGYKHDGGAGVNAQTQAMKGYGGAVNDATKAQDKLNASKAKGAKGSKAKKEAGKIGGLANFDEIHTLPKKEGSSSGGGAGAGGGGGVGGIGGGGLPQVPDPTAGLAQKLTEAQQKVAEFAESFKAFMQPIIQVCSDIWNAVVTYVQGAFQGINDWWTANGDYIAKGFKFLWDNILYPVFKFLVEMIWGNVKGAIDGLITFFEGLIQFVGGIFSGEWRKAMEGLWMMVKGAFQAIWNIINLMWIGEGVKAVALGLKGIGTAFRALFEIGGKDSLPALVTKALKAISQFFKECWEFVGKDFKIAWGAIQDVFTVVIPRVIKNSFNAVEDTLSTWGSRAWSWITSPFKSLVSWFASNIANPLKSVFNNILSGAMDGVINGLKYFINNHVRPTLNKALEFADNIPGVDIGWRMPQLYNGGITNGKMIAQIGDNVGGQEVVAPLDRLTNIIAQTMRSTLAMNGGGGGNGGSTEVVLKVGSTEFGRVCVDSINKLTKQEGRLALNI